jgi:pyrroloquinoline-quinone synthase
MSPAPRVTALAEQILARSNPLDGPYFAALRCGEMSLERFRSSQEQFFYAVQYYARPIAALVARIPDPKHRLDLVHNLVEEHGDFDEKKFHPTTFGQFLKSIGGRRPDEAGVGMGAGAHAFNAVLIGTCMTDEVETGVACLGIIELAFAGISAAIGGIVVERGWVPREKLMHYALHAELDVEHAQEFFAMLEPVLDDPRKRAAIEAGLSLGAHVFDRLYRDLAEA